MKEKVVHPFYFLSKSTVFMGNYLLILGRKEKKGS